jgi:hypothetical protein
MKKNSNIVTSTLNNLFNSKIFSNKIFTNKITLYVVFAIAFISLYRHIILYEFSAVLLFFVVGALAYNFTKNMTIVLGSAFLSTIVVSMFKGVLGFKEGAENMEKSESKSESKSENASENTSESKPAKKMDASSIAMKADVKDAEKLLSSVNPLEGGIKTSGYENQIPLTPGLYNMPNKEQMTKQLGKASETEQAYDNLEKIMGSKNIQTMSSDTKDLIKQQNDLIKQLKAMTPALNEAMTALGGLDLSKLTNMFNKHELKAE